MTDILQPRTQKKAKPKTRETTLGKRERNREAEEDGIKQPRMQKKAKLKTGETGKIEQNREAGQDRAPKKRARLNAGKTRREVNKKEAQQPQTPTNNSTSGYNLRART